MSTEYKILRSDSIKELERLVNMHLNHLPVQWALAGSMTIHSAGLYCQPITSKG